MTDALPFQESLKRRPGVLYVELCGDSDSAFLRLESAAAAARCVASGGLRDAVLLSGEGAPKRRGRQHGM